MRIGFDARWYNGSGVGTYVKELLTALADLSEFELVVVEDPRNHLPIAMRKGIAVVPVRSPTFSISSQFELKSMCASLGIDLFHCPFQYGVPMRLACPLVITVHDLIPFLFRTRSWPKQAAVVPIVKWGYRAAALRAEHIITVSENTAADAEKILAVGRERMTSIPLAASAAFHPIADSGERERLSRKYGIRCPYVVVGSTGNWRTKNLETALRVLERTRRMSGAGFQTVVYGPHQAIEIVLGRKNAISLDICCAGYLPVDELAALFRNAQLFLMPSLYEGFGLPVLEAMSCGCPVVTSTGGSLPEVAAGAALIFDPMDANGMSQAVSLLLQNSGERERWRARAIARAQQFSWRETAKQTASVYRHVLGIKGAGGLSPQADSRSMLSRDVA
jgi:glycosyltransferase involved in cell wall biosynthesis